MEERVIESEELRNEEAEGRIDPALRIENRVASILKGIAVIIFIGGFIAGIVLASESHISWSGKTTTEFNFWLALLYWALTFVAGMMFFGFGEAIQILHDVRAK